MYKLGLSDGNEWKTWARREHPGFIGLGSDLLFFVESLFRFQRVPFRYAVIDIYSEAVKLAKSIVDINKADDFDKEISKKFLILYNRYKKTPQLASIIRLSS